MLTSDFSAEVEIRPFRACTMKNVQYNSYFCQNRQNLHPFKEIGVDKHNGNIRF